MADDIIRYDVLAQEAMRGVVKKVLTEVARSGLPGDHHFYITFNTQAPGVRVSSRLRERYPEEMTIVVQHQFWDLEIGSQSFEIGLAFSGVPEKLLIPFSAIKSFVDPSVQFGLQFDLVEEEISPEGEISPASGTAIVTKAPSAVVLTDADIDRAIETEAAAEEILAASEASGKKPDAEGKPLSADVVSLDAFRKKAE